MGLIQTVSCVETMKAPENKKEVRQMLGFFSYFRTYIDRFAEVANPLTDLTKKNVSNHVHWSGHQSIRKLLSC